MTALSVTIPRSAACLATAFAVLLATNATLAYERFNDGCDNCHGGFRSSPYRSQLDNHAWPSSLHNVHRNSTYMAADCGTCHVNDGDATKMASSRKGAGCSGCHEARGLREHHRITGAHSCASGCHSASESPRAESVQPAFYVVLSKIADPCNSSPAGPEDWSGDGLGLDNDGDGLYDANDPDCAASNQPPEAQFEFSQTKCTFSVAFLDTSTDPDRDDAVVERAWDFNGDDVVDATGNAPTWDFGAPGSYDVQLVVKDKKGEAATALIKVAVVGNLAPVADFSVTLNANVCEFQDLSTDIDGAPGAWLWEFGDGSTADAASGTHTYSSPGTYTIALQVADDCGDTARAEKLVEVLEVSVLFSRGDCNQDGVVNISDALCILGWLYLGNESPGCLATTNANGDTQANLSDAVHVLSFLFSGGPPPAAPFPGCGPGRVPADDELGCERPSTHCQA